MTSLHGFALPSSGRVGANAAACVGHHFVNLATSPAHGHTPLCHLSSAAAIIRLARDFIRPHTFAANKPPLSKQRPASDQRNPARRPCHEGINPARAFEKMLDERELAIHPIVQDSVQHNTRVSVT